MVGAEEPGGVVLRGLEQGTQVQGIGPGLVQGGKQTVAIVVAVLPETGGEQVGAGRDLLGGGHVEEGNVPRLQRPAQAVDGAGLGSDINGLY